MFYKSPGFNPCIMRPNITKYNYEKQYVNKLIKILNNMDSTITCVRCGCA